jgi:hypothetical protein
MHCSSQLYHNQINDYHSIKGSLLMSTMFQQLVTASLLLCYLTVSASGQQHLKGKQLDSVKHVHAISMNAEIAVTDTLESIKESESVSVIKLEGLTGYIATDATFTDSTCSAFKSAVLYPLNTCFFLDSPVKSYNTMITATTSSYTVESFTDEQCTVSSSIKRPTVTPYSNVCSDIGQKTFLQPSSQVVTSKSLMYYR